MGDGDDDDNVTTACLVTDAFETTSTELLVPLPPPVSQRSVLHTTLGVASSAATLVLVPCVNAAAHATSAALSAPVQWTRHARVTIAQSWTGACHADKNDEARDGDESHLSATLSRTRGGEREAHRDRAVDGARDERSGRTQSLLYVPVRLLYRSVSTAVAIPTQVAVYSGRKIAGAVSASHALATSAVLASTGAASRTGRHVAMGMKHGAVSTVSYTASTLVDAVGASVRTVGHVVPPSVSHALWQGMDVTGNASVNALSYAIAVPAYRMVQALVPAVDQLLSEEDAVKETRTAVKALVQVLGPQNAYYCLKWIYETVNSEAAHDSLLLCYDVLHESLDGENYHRAAASVSTATGITSVVHVLKEAYNVVPSLDEILDAVVLVADVSDEVVDGVAHVAPKQSSLNAPSESDEATRTRQWEYVDNVDDRCEEHRPAERTDAVVESALLSQDESNSLAESGLSLLTRLCDSEEASSLFNTFGDFLDVLVD
ncbi:unnamed protein product [Hyaloperonospora brassicae]|uniref:Uncharacterized protein n=1 Tax=Hyaloperonospora brassicae TaxID=162125 RepID=A0AAV0TD53_HYABA|nr:unnamed protein product [Hyaloperonospora brassicae]